MNAWSHLPNAAHIDRLLESEKAYPEVWRTAWNMAWDMAYDAAGSAAWDMAWGAGRHVAWNMARDMARVSVRGAILALVAYDDSAKYLDMPIDQLKMWAILSEEPAAILLLPAVIAYEKIGELELA